METFGGQRISEEPSFCPNTSESVPTKILMPLSDDVAPKHESPLYPAGILQMDSEQLHCCENHFDERYFESNSDHQIKEYSVWTRGRVEVFPSGVLLPGENNITIKREVPENISNPPATVGDNNDGREHTYSSVIPRNVEESPEDESTVESRYLPQALPQLPTCNHDRNGPFQCKKLSALDICSFYSEFYDLPTSTAQNAFLFELLERTSKFPVMGQVGFKFYIKQKRKDSSVVKVPVCSATFIGALSLEITWLVTIATRHFDTLDENIANDSGLCYSVPEAQPSSSAYVSSGIKMEPVLIDETTVENRNSQRPFSNCKFDASENLATCFKCCRSFSSVRSLREHLSNSSCPPVSRESAPPVVCVNCNVPFSSKYGLWRHLKRSQECRGKYPANMTANVSRSADPGRRVQNNMYMCTKCNAVFVSVWGLRAHQRNTSNCRPNKLYPSPKVVVRSDIERVKKSYTNTRHRITVPRNPNCNGQMMSYHCNVCFAEFMSILGLRKHERDSACGSPETSDSVYACSTCNLVFVREKLLQNHFKTSPECASNERRGDADGGLYACPKCPLQFETSIDTERHFALHSSSESVYSCHLCEKYFATSDLLLQHRHWEHIGHWFCFFCHIDFNSFILLYQHISNLHTEIQSDFMYKCEICLKGFHRRKKFVKHLSRCNRNSEVYSCSICRKNFSKRNHIINHIKFAHDGVPHDTRYNIQCQSCPKVFSSDSDLVHHISNGCAEEDKRLVCDHCSDIYYGKAELEFHNYFCHSLLDPSLNTEPSLTSTNECRNVKNECDP